MLDLAVWSTNSKISLSCIYRYFHQLLLRTSPFPLALSNLRNKGRGGQQFKTSGSPSVVGVTPISPRVKTGHYGPNARRPEQTALMATLFCLCLWIGGYIGTGVLLFSFQVCPRILGHSGTRQDQKTVYLDIICFSIRQYYIQRVVGSAGNNIFHPSARQSCTAIYYKPQ